MRLVSPLLKHVIYPGLSGTGYFEAASQGPAVLTYHGILPSDYESSDSHIDGNLVTAKAFRLQLEFLKRQYNVIHPEQFHSWLKGEENLPDRAVLLTCDDGLKNCVTEMLPLLQSFNLSCLFFVTGACLDSSPSILWNDELWLWLRTGDGRLSFDIAGKRFYAKTFAHKRSLWWMVVNELSSFDHQRRNELLREIKDQLCSSASRSATCLSTSQQDRFLLLSPFELQQLSKAGMSIGAHTLSHPVLSKCDEASARSEILWCKQRLENFCGKEIWALAFPFGDSKSAGSREYDLAQQAGFACAFLNCEGSAADSDKFALPRVHITCDMRLPEFAAHVSGVHRELQKLFA